MRELPDNDAVRPEGEWTLGRLRRRILGLPRLGRPGSQPMSDPERYQHVKSLFREACALEGPARDAFLEEIRREDASLAREVELLLRFHGERAANTDPNTKDPEWETDHSDPASSGEETFGPYRELKLLGRGGQAVVYEAVDGRLGRRVALKILEGFVAGSEAGVRRFKREAAIAARLRHPGICAVYEAGVIERTPYMAMELVEGETLHSLIATARDEGASDVSTFFLQDDATEEEPAETTGSRDASSPGSSSSGPSDLAGIRRLCALFEEIARALHAAHEQGVIHRDIKPGNIMLKPDGRPVILDFGLARSDDEDFQTLTRTGDFMGTVPYMSPEQFLVQRVRLDRRTDVYSLGVTLFEALTCRRPFEAPTREGIVQAIQFKDPPDLRRLNPAIPPDLKTIVEKTLEKDRDRRYETAEALADDLRRFLDLQPISARPVTRWIRTKRWAQRNPGVATSLLLAFLFLSGGLATSLVLLDRATEAEQRAAIQRDRAEAERNRASQERDRANQERDRASAERDAKEAALRKAEAERANVLRLSAFQTLGDLEREADEALWPLLPEKIPLMEAWLEKARKLVSGLDPDPTTGAPGHRQQLRILEARALPQTAAEGEAEIRSHPRFQELQNLEAKLAWLRRAQAVRGDKARPTPFKLKEEKLPSDGSGLNALAWPLVKPDRQVFGREAEGLALARRAFAAAKPSERHTIGDTLAWALFANGLDAEALEASRAALAAAPEKNKKEFQGYLEKLQAAIRDLEGAKGKDRVSALAREVALLEAEVSRRRHWRFAKEEDRWWHEQLTRLVAELEAFQNERTGLMGTGSSPDHGWGVGKRLAFLRSLRRRTLEDPAVAWRAAIQRIRKNPRYHGLELPPQLGLVPLGPDPASGLEEFAETASGRVPKRDPGTGRLALTEDMGLVFVLLPGGTFTMGAQKKDPEGANFDPQAGDNEGPPHLVTLTPFFMSKFELTQGQWARLTGKHPSRYASGETWSGKKITDLNPVTDVSWDECARTLRRFALELPTEAQWESGACGGTRTVWWPGNAVSDLKDAGNIADATAHRFAPSWGVFEDALDDGHVVHAPAGTFRANGFGLHDTLGNVWEWCRDWYTSYGSPERAGDGLRGIQPSRRRVYRGGSFYDPARLARSANRGHDTPGIRFSNLGCRPVRVITK